MANILIIDDDKDIQRLLEFALKRAGYSVEVASDGEQGLAVAMSENPDLIVCDVMMPKMTGYEFCRQARTKDTLKKTPIIVFSARFQPVDKQTALDAATDYLPKSTAPTTLVKRIEELLPQQQDLAQTKTARGTIAIFSLRGGVGATSLAVNVAAGLAISQKTKVAFVDMVDVGGHAALMLGVRPTSHLNNLLTATKNTFTPDIIQPHLINHKSGVQLLASAPGFTEQPGGYNTRLLHLIKSLKSTFAINVLDAPNLLNAQVSPVLQFVDQLLLVMSADMPSVQSTAIGLQGLLKLGLADKKISLVVNQTAQYNTLPVESIQKAIRRPVRALIPFDPAMTKAVNTGTPLIFASPQSPAAKAIGLLVTKLFAETRPA